MKGNTRISPLPQPRAPVGITAVIFRPKTVARICDFFTQISAVLMMGWRRQKHVGSITAGIYQVSKTVS